MLREVIAISPIAEKLLKTGGTVCGVFSSALGISCGKLVVMLQKEDIATPCGGVISPYRPEELKGLIGADAEWRDNKIFLGNRICYDVSHVRHWEEIYMEPLPRLKKTEYAETREILRKLLPMLRKETGLSVLLENLGWSQGKEPQETAYYWRSEKAIKILHQGLLSVDIAQIHKAHEGLVGFGVGLTPSGDDFLTAFWSTVRMRYDGRYQKLYGKAIQDLTSLSERTNCYGWSELWAMQQGWISKPLKAAIEMLDGGGQMKDSLIKLAEIGGTTGADMMLGIAEAISVLEELDEKGQSEE